MLAVLLLIVTTSSANAACPVWTVLNKTSSQCVCGDSLEGLVSCSLNPHRISVLLCQCLTYNEEIKKETVGKCLVTCRHLTHNKCTSYYRINSENPEDLNDEVCGALNRTGQLCGDCIAGYGPPVLSYSLQCVECSIEHFAWKLLEYLFFAFLPLTVMYVIVIVWKVSITSHKMVAYVFTCQLLTAPYILKLADSVTKQWFITLVLDCLSFWNMDIFRSSLPPFCLHPSLNTMQVIALDYLVAVYPMLLIVLTYIAVTLHDKYRLLATAWRPAAKVLACIRKEWNIRGSLVQGFTTFLVLSYVKVLNISMELLNPVHIHESHYLDTLYYLYSAGTVPYFGKEHYLYGILAITMLLLFIILPTLFLAFYPMSCFRRCLGINSSVATSTFMDAFTGCYRVKHVDMRGFVAVYLVARVLNLLTFVIMDSSTLVMTAFYLIALAVTVILVQPYQNRMQNKLDGVLLLNAACIFLLKPVHDYFLSFDRREYKKKHLSKVLMAASVVFITAHVLYGIVVLLGKICPDKVLKWFLKGPSLKNEEVPLIA